MGSKSGKRVARVSEADASAERRIEDLREVPRRDRAGCRDVPALRRAAVGPARKGSPGLSRTARVALRYFKRKRPAPPTDRGYWAASRRFSSSSKPRITLISREEVSSSLLLIIRK